MKINIILLLLTILTLSSCNYTINSAIIPTDKLDVEWWKNRHEQVLEQIKEKDPQLILIGNSITSCQVKLVWVNGKSSSPPHDVLQINPWITRKTAS